MQVAWRLDSCVAQSRAAISPSTCARATSVSTSRETAQGEVTAARRRLGSADAAAWSYRTNLT